LDEVTDTATETPFVVTEGTIPTDDPPPTDTPFPVDADAPYGYKADGTPYKRRRNNTGTAKSAPGRRLVASESQARTAANMLGQINQIMGMALASAQFPRTGGQIVEANAQFVEMAYESLLTDPALCRKILSAGASSGKSGLIMAYGMLTLAVVPAAREEIRERRLANQTDEETNNA